MVDMSEHAGREAIMPMWRIRVTLPDDPRSLARLTDALADRPMSLVGMTPKDHVGSDLVGEILLDLQHGDGLGALLGALHEISPQVLVSRADESASPTPAGA
jgi:hypothetical protein